jgi:hypothetical protein
MTPKEIQALRARARAALEKEGVTALSKRINVEPRTLILFAHGAVRSHPGTIAQIHAALEKT